MAARLDCEVCLTDYCEHTFRNVLEDANARARKLAETLRDVIAADIDERAEVWPKGMGCSHTSLAAAAEAIRRRTNLDAMLAEHGFGEEES